MQLELEIEKVKKWLGGGSINIFGMPFAGKDTQCTILADLLDGVALSGGQILRESAPADLMRDTNKGKLFPTEEYIEIVTPYLAKSEFKDKPLILSAVGRWHGEEPGIIGATKASNHPIKAVFYLKVDESTARQRHAKIDAESRGLRQDDSPEYLDQRFEEFKNKTLAVIDFYRNKNLLIEIDANQSSEKVTDEVLIRLAALT